jgi:hypothetical protein
MTVNVYFILILKQKLQNCSLLIDSSSESEALAHTAVKLQFTSWQITISRTRSFMSELPRILVTLNAPANTGFLTQPHWALLLAHAHFHVPLALSIYCISASLFLCRLDCTV